MLRKTLIKSLFQTPVKMFLIEVNKSVLVGSALISSVKLILILLVVFYNILYRYEKIFNLITKIGYHNKQFQNITKKPFFCLSVFRPTNTFKNHYETNPSQNQD